MRGTSVLARVARGVTAADVLKGRIREAGLRSTNSRVSVLQVLERAGRPMSHGEVAAALTGAGFDHATVYRNLSGLTEAGLVARADLGDHTWRFELRGGRADHATLHPHFVCTTCGEIVYLPSDSVPVHGGAAERPLPAGSPLAVKLQGLCDACDKQSAQAGTP
jgi:Fur family ferric uptake transcriptional regulator